jgi:hypothetical protein
MTNNEIKKDIQKRINKLGVIGAYTDMVLANAKVIKPQILGMLKTDEGKFYFFNMCHSFTIKSIQNVGLFNLFKKDVFTEGLDNVITDEIYKDTFKKVNSLI